MSSNEKKIRHSWIQNGTFKQSKKCVTCGVLKDRINGGKVDVFNVDGKWVTENPNCIDNSKFY